MLIFNESLMHPSLIFFMGAAEIFVILFALMPVIFIGWAFIDVLRSEFRSQSTKAFWILGILLLPLIGAILYALLGRSQRIDY